MKQNPINHVALILDASSSMGHLQKEVVQVADQQIASLAQLSTQLEQETRVSVYVFSNPHNITCIIFDRDVLRLGSLAGEYRPQGNTALIDATLKGIEDLEKTATMYGDHAFLIYVQTDGEENSSVAFPKDLIAKLKTLPENWTLACLVPNSSAKINALSFGFAAGNIAIWDASSEKGVRESGETITRATAAYMDARASGTKGTRTLFSMDSTVVNHKTVAATLKELTGFRIEHVKDPAVIKPFIEGLGLPFITGRYYFPLIKREKISDAKEVVIRHKISGKIYGGPQARVLVGLPDSGQVSVKPQPNPEYDVFVQSTSNNRNLIPGHDLLIKV